MSKYIKLEEPVNALIELEAKLGSQQQAQRGVRLAIGYVNNLPTIEVSEDNQVLYGTDHNCILTMFGECSYNETGCSDCAVAEKIREALRVEVNEDCISREDLSYKVGRYYEERGDFGSFECFWILDAIRNAPSVVPSRAIGKWTHRQETYQSATCSKREWRGDEE